MVRKTQKGAGTTYTREKALSDVRNGNKTTRGAATLYNIPRSTLKHYILGTRGKEVLKKESKSKPQVKRRRIVSNCEIITSNEYLKKREQEDKEKKDAIQRKKDAASKKIKKQNKKPEKIIDDEASDTSDNFLIQESDNDSKFWSSEDKEPINDNCFNICDFCIVKVYGKTAAVFRLYVAKQKDEFVGRFFKRHPQIWKFIETDEESLIAKRDIIRKLSKPIKSSSARYKDMIGFSTDLSDLTILC
ncbi:unnamed protein product [Psylliodes chrysocephalus]|uniref:HTH psq-type domain-containing protein n=1 Tax=Psylliodes chrysocephalus TaxID=3402493 RepID=A0A9P0CJ54_9CUCU|nr:unnamed protein product [Psylliodes chrysocephala]